MKITKTTLKALQILDVEHGEGITAKQFAEKMWPDSPHWTHVKNTGHGATSGKGMWLTAGSYLAKLKSRNLVVIDSDFWDSPVSATTWRISHEGRKIMTNTLEQADLPVRVQCQNPRTQRYVKIDRVNGKILSTKKSPGPYKNIQIIKSSKFR